MNMTAWALEIERWKVCKMVENAICSYDNVNGRHWQPTDTCQTLLIPILMLHLWLQQDML
jgi:hypothetical protein